jgi:RNA polymerase sigma-70 factor (ECF subfamily)
MTAVEFNHQLMSMNDSLNRYAYSLTARREDALDLTQETYLKALTNRDKYADFTNLKAWVFTIMKNTFINSYRKSSRENTAFDNTKDLYFLNNSRISTIPAPDSVHREEEINKKIESLEEEFRVPFQMFISGYKYKEIADELDLNIGTVKSRIFFSRKKLMEALEGHSN